jgi:hypothetical protein
MRRSASGGYYGGDYYRDDYPANRGKRKLKPGAAKPVAKSPTAQ